MTVDTSIGADDPRTRESGIDDEDLTEENARKAREDGASEEKTDLTREDIEAGNDRNASADQGNRSPTTNKLPDQGIPI